LKPKKILIEIGHPAHVHLFKNLYWELLKKGWDGLFIAKDKDCVIDLLRTYQLPFELLGVNRKGVLNKILSLPVLAYKTWRIASQFKPDIFVSRVSPFSGYASFILRKPHITFTDTENVKLLDFISEPFADIVLSSTSYLREHGKKHLRYPGYHELAYLHPKRYQGDQNIYKSLGLNKNEKYAIIRFVSWTAHHDIGIEGISKENKLKLVKELSKIIRIFISSEEQLPPDLEKYQIKIKPEQMHDVLNFAQLYVGESVTMASECAILGTPTIVFIENRIYGVVIEQYAYGLLDILPLEQPDIDKCIKIAQDLISSNNPKQKQAKKRQKMLQQKIDVSSFMVWLIENYPESIDFVKGNKVNWSDFR